MVIVAFADVKAVLTRKWAIIDASIAMQNMAIAAWTLGGASCWISDFKRRKSKIAAQNTLKMESCRTIDSRVSN